MTSTALPRRSPWLRFAGLRAVLERDFLVFTSRPRFLVLRTLTVVLPTLVLCAILLSSGVSGGMGSSRIGQSIIMMSIVMLPALVMLLAPVLAASCIASERALNTLDIVLATPVSPFAFVLAKFLSRLCVVLVLVFATLPLAGICLLYGGVSAGLFLELIAFLVSAAILGTASGIVASAWARNVAAAALSSYFVAVALPLMHLFGALAWLEPRSSLGNLNGELGLNGNVFYVWSRMMESGIGGGVARGHPGFVLLAYTCGVAVLGIAFAGWRIGREAGHQVARRGGERRAAVLRYDNPVLDRALRGTLLHRPKAVTWFRLLMVLVLIGIVVSIAAANRELHREWPHITFLAVTMVVLALAAMTTAAHSISSERETGALDMLLATRLTAAEVARGKFLGTLLGIAPLLVIALLYGLAAVTYSKLQLVTVLAWLVSASVLIVFVAAVGTWCSATASTAGRAVMKTYALVIGGSVLHGVGAIIAMMLGHRVLGDEGAMYLFGPSPGFVGSMLMVVATERSSDPDLEHAFVSWLLWGTVYVVTALWLARKTARTLERRNEAS